MRAFVVVGLVGTLACESEPRRLVVGDEEPTESGGETATPERDADRWPRDYVAGPGTGAALLFEGPGGLARIGYISEGTPLSIAGFPDNGYVPIRIMEGGMKVKALIAADRFSLRVQQRGKLGGTSVYVTPGDYVQFVAPADDEGIFRVRAGARFGREGIEMPSFEGIYPAERLGTAVPAPDESFQPGEPHSLPAGMEVPLFESPGGEAVTTLPAVEPPMVVQVVQARGEWKAIRVGTGPYLVGYTNADLSPAEALEPEPQPRPTAAEGEVPMRLRHDEQRPLWRVRAGTWVRYAEEKVARLEADGWAREMGRTGEGGSATIDAFVAVDDSVAIRGMVPQDALFEVAGQPAQPAAAPAAATESAPESAPAE
jgi:hypothetical protein